MRHNFASYRVFEVVRDELGEVAVRCAPDCKVADRLVVVALLALLGGPLFKFLLRCLGFFFFFRLLPPLEHRFARIILIDIKYRAGLRPRRRGVDHIAWRTSHNCDAVALRLLDDFIPMLCAFLFEAPSAETLPKLRWLAVPIKQVWRATGIVRACLARRRVELRLGEILAFAIKATIYVIPPQGTHMMRIHAFRLFLNLTRVSRDVFQTVGRNLLALRDALPPGRREVREILAAKHPLPIATDLGGDLVGCHAVGHELGDKV